jgi:hypothetical protein
MQIEIAHHLFIGSFIITRLFTLIQKSNSKRNRIIFRILSSVTLYTLFATLTGYLNSVLLPNYAQTTENVHTIYNNKENINVVYHDFDYTYEGGAESKANLRFVLAGLTDHSNKLTVTKGTESISKTIDEDEIVGDKNGIVTKIEFGTRKHTYSPLGLPALTTEKSFVRIHLKPKNPKDRKAIENLLDGKTK